MTAKLIIPVLVTLMLLTGVCNTLLTKYQDLQCVRNCDSPDPSQRETFKQPVLQTVQMFIGEMGCWLVVLVYAIIRRATRRGYEPIPDRDANGTTNPALKPLISQDGRRVLSGWRVILLAIPSCFDITGTTLMNVGLLYVAASIYQMTRGALVLFVGLFSVIFLKRKLFAYQWFALVVVMLGVALVGLAGAIDKKDASPSEPTPQSSEVDDKHTALETVLGVIMIAVAQIFTASQFVVEEFILEKYSIEPLKMVGWEGVWGFTVTVIGMIILHFTVGVTDYGRGKYFDAVEGWREMTTYRTIAISSFLIMLSIGGFNFFGLSVTRSVSATSRSTIDTSRTLFIWIVSLGLHWETFKWLQIVGFVLLVYGTFLFNDIVTVIPCTGCFRKKRPAPLLAEEPIEHM